MADIVSLQRENARLRQDSTFTNALLAYSTQYNTATGLGIRGRDKRMSTGIREIRLHRDTIDALYDGNKYAAKLIDSVPSYETRKWARFTMSAEASDPDLKKAMQAIVDEIEVDFREARIADRKYGGAGILLGINDGRSADQPINEVSIRSIEFSRVHEGGRDGELQVQRYDDDIMSDGYGKPLYYRLSGTAELIHRDRILLFHELYPGKRRSKDRFAGWGIPVLNRAIGSIMNLGSAVDGVAATLQDFNKILVKLKDLAELLQAGERGLLQERIRQMEFGSSLLNAIVLDGEDDYSIQARPMAGIPEAIQVLRDDLVAVAEIPHTKYFNQSPAGVTSGSSERSDFVEAIAASQNDNIRPNLVRYCKLQMLAKDGPTNGELLEDGTWDLEFPPIQEPTISEVAEIEEKRSRAYQNYRNSGAVSAYDIATALANESPIGDVIDLDAMKREQNRAMALIEPMAATPPAPTAVEEPEMEEPDDETELEGRDEEE